MNPRRIYECKYCCEKHKSVSRAEDCVKEHDFKSLLDDRDVGHLMPKTKDFIRVYEEVSE